mgnify:CR=1 FL=1
MRSNKGMIIRADGGLGIGMGHIMRTLVLADYLKEYLNITYICDEDYKDGIDYLKHRGYPVFAYKKDELLKHMLKREESSILTDSYRLDNDYIKSVRQTFKVVGYMDDNALFPYEADYVINQNFGAEVTSYEVSNECELLLGSHYLLLRCEFRKQLESSVKDAAREIMITVGGSDPYNVLDKILSTIYDMPFHFHVVIGITFPYENDVRNKYKDIKNIRFYKQPDIEKLMRKCDMAVSSCGSTLYELGVCGVQTIGVSVADNQVPLAERMAKQGMIEYLGSINTLNKNVIRQSITTLAHDKVKREHMKKLNEQMLNKDGVKVAAAKILSKMGI